MSPVQTVASFLIIFLLPDPATAGGWSPDRRLTSSPAPSLTEADGGSNVVASGDDLYVVFTDTRHGNPEIYFKERIGTAWQPVVRLTNDSGTSFSPAIGRQPNGDLRVVWADARPTAEIWYKTRTATGWSADSCLTCDAFLSLFPALDHTGEHIVWGDYRHGNPEIYYRRWRGDGLFDPEVRISDDPALSFGPTVASPTSVDTGSPTTAPDLVLVGWEDSRHGSPEIYTRLCTVGSWGPETRISNDPASSSSPSVMVEWGGGHLQIAQHAVVWQDDRDGNQEIYWANGFQDAWSGEVRLTNTPEPSLHPSLFTSWHTQWDIFGLALLPYELLAWAERDLANTTGSIEVMDLASFVQSTVSDSGSDASAPSITASHELPGGDRRFEVVWTDQRDGNSEVYESFAVETIEGVGVEAGPAPAGALLGPAQPNPFRGSTSFALHLLQAQPVDVRITDVAGRSVRVLASGERRAGTHTLSWDGRDDDGHPTAAGVYFARARTADAEARSKIVRLR